ncbi:MAG: 2-hydroxyacid dehydrogenase [Chloroflexota bacterium]
MPTLNVHLSSNRDLPNLDLLRNYISDDVCLTTGESVPAEADIHILINGRPTSEEIENNPNLHTVIIPWAGIPPKTGQLLKNHPHISVHNLHHNALPVAETVFALYLAAAKQLLPHDKTFRQNDWTLRYASDDRSPLIRDQRALILGYGAIGRQVARYCQAFGMELSAIRRSVNEKSVDALGTAVYPPASLHNLLPQTNALFISLPLTDETEDMIGKRELALLPDGATIINVGRAKIIQEVALFEALKNGRLRAGLDVWYTYPKDEAARANTAPANFPFNDLPNVILSPHRAGLSSSTEQLRMEALGKMIETAVAGKTLPNKMDLDKGY